MEEEVREDRAVGSMRLWEIVVAAGFLVFGALVVWESRRLGSAWASDGPQAGYFPFYIGLIICIASAANLLAAFNARAKGARPFVHWSQLRMVLTVMVPSVVYVGLMENPFFSLGIYASSALFIAFFMGYLGRYPWHKILAVVLGVVISFFMMFEVWFKVPLPKGPIEALFGFQ